MTITVFGQPAPQGSKRYVGQSKTGRGIMIESSKAVKPWRQDVRAAALDAMADRIQLPEIEQRALYFDPSGALSVHMIFTLPKPKSAAKRYRTWPNKKPDLSKLVRSTEDALTEAGIWEDDARIVHCVSSKCYPGEGVDSLNSPGAVIHIRQVQA